MELIQTHTNRATERLNALKQQRLSHGLTITQEIEFIKLKKQVEIGEMNNE